MRGNRTASVAGHRAHALAAAALVAAAAPFAACRGGSGDGGGVVGCGSDADCKGDRICVNSACVEPDDAGAAGRPAGGAGAAGGGVGVPGGGASDSGVGGGGGADADGVGAGAPGAVVDDPALEAACIRDCEAKHAAGCPMPIASLDQCMGQCLVIDEYNHGYCLREQRLHYDCLASGGYTCASGYPQPKSTCIAEAQALTACNLDVPCRRFCDVAEGRCAPGGSMCFETCMATRNGFEDFICSYDYDRLLTCWSDNLVCDGARPSVAGCEAAAAEIADCVGRRQHTCDGYCWAVDLLGCAATDCVTSCMARTADSSCGYRYESLLRCAYQSNALYFTCEGGTPVPTADCATAEQEYAACIAM